MIKYLTPSLLIVLLSLSDLCLANERMAVPGGEFSIVWESAFNQKEKDKLRTWLQQAAKTASLVNGKFPLSKTHIFVNKYSRGSAAVPWANTVRNITPEGVEFHVNTNSTLSSFINDWTAVHEFSHLYISYPGKNDIWISEGFASYYQYLLMARAGILKEKQAWQKLADGFDRGKNDPNRGISLAKLSTQMQQKSAYMRVYWSGALFFLEADIALRKRGKSLDSVVTQYAKCCRRKQQYQNGLELVKSFDTIADTNLFVPLYKSYQRDSTFRDYRKILKQLGIYLNNNNTVSLDNKQPLRRLREKFTQSQI